MAVPTGGSSKGAARLRVLHVLPMLSALWIASASLASGTPQLPQATPYQVSPSCPCLAQSEVIARVRESVANNDAIRDFCPDGLLPATIAKGKVPGVQCLPNALGSGTCRAWDAALDPVCESRRQISRYSAMVTETSARAASAKWCSHGWCYVDPTNCTLPVAKSTLFPEAKLHYSYATCGYVDTFGPRLFEQSVMDVIRRNSIRVTYPGDDAYRIWRPNGESVKEPVTNTVTGSFVRAFQEASVIMASFTTDLVFTEVPITQDRLDFVEEEFGYSSSYTACAVMLGMNLTDVCAGSFWSLPERHAVSQYLYSWEGDEVYLASYKKEPGGADILSGIFLPFTGYVWGLFALTVAFSVVLFAWMEIAPRMEATLRAWNAERAAAPDAGGIKGRLQRSLEILLMSLEGVLDFHPEGYNPLSNGGKLLKMCYVMFIGLFMATYTANLAAILGGQSRYEFENLEQAIAQGATLCIPSVLKPKISMKYPGIEALSVPVPYTDVLDGMDEGRCQAGLTYDAIFTTAPQRHCNKAMVGKPLTVLSVSAVSQPLFAQSFNMALNQLEASGRLMELTSEYIDIYNEGVNKFQGCGVGQGFDEASDKLTATQMGGLFGLFLIGATAAFLIDLWERCCPRLFGKADGVAFKVAGRSSGLCYLRDEFKDTYVIRMPPGLQYPNFSPSQSASDDDSLPAAGAPGQDDCGSPGNSQLDSIVTTLSKMVQNTDSIKSNSLDLDFRSC